MKAWLPQHHQPELRREGLKYEIVHDKKDREFSVWNFVIGRERTPLANKIVSIANEPFCRVSKLDTGDEVTKINLGSTCQSIAVDKTQSLIAIGTQENVTFVETTNFTKVKEVSLTSDVFSLGFNRQNDCMIAVTRNGEIHSFKF